VKCHKHSCDCVLLLFCLLSVHKYCEKPHCLRTTVVHNHTACTQQLSFFFIVSFQTSSYYKQKILIRYQILYNSLTVYVRWLCYRKMEVNIGKIENLGTQSEAHIQNSCSLFYKICYKYWRKNETSLFTLIILEAMILTFLTICIHRD
jgi:hypothetical protein